jgi:hypothetical protein
VRGDGRTAATEGTWQRIHEAGVLHDWASVDAVALAIGATSPTGDSTGRAGAWCSRRSVGGRAST